MQYLGFESLIQIRAMKHNTCIHLTQDGPSLLGKIFYLLQQSTWVLGNAYRAIGEGITANQPDTSMESTEITLSLSGDTDVTVRSPTHPWDGGFGSLETLINSPKSSSTFDYHFYPEMIFTERLKFT